MRQATLERGLGGAAALAADVSSDNGLPKTIEYQKVTGEIESGQTYSLVTTTLLRVRVRRSTAFCITRMVRRRWTSVKRLLTPTC
mgnify:CR=1 FL=1